MSSFNMFLSILGEISLLIHILSFSFLSISGSYASDSFFSGVSIS